MQSVDSGHLGGAFKKFVHYNNIDGHYKFHSFILKNPKQLIRSSGDRLEGKGENYQVCSVQYCVQQLCTVRCTHI